MTLGSSSGWLEGDVVAEFLEASDESFGGAFGAASPVVVAAEFAVNLMGSPAVLSRCARL